MTNPPDTSNEPVTTVLVADRQALSLKSLVAVIAEVDGLTVCATAASGFAALEAIVEHRPAVAVLDRSFEDLDGLAILNAVERDDIETRCVLVARPSDAEAACEAIAAGASGWIDRAASPTEVRASIRAAASGSVFITPRAHTALRAEMIRRATVDPSEIDEATREVLQLSADDLTPHEIAARLHLAPATVKGRLQAAAKRCGVRGTTGAVAKAMREGRIR